MSNGEGMGRAHLDGRLQPPLLVSKGTLDRIKGEQESHRRQEDISFRSWGITGRGRVREVAARRASARGRGRARAQGRLHARLGGRRPCELADILTSTKKRALASRSAKQSSPRRAGVLASAFSCTTECLTDEATSDRTAR